MACAADKVKEYRDEFTDKTEKLIKEVFPTKVVLLNEFLKDKFNIEDLKKIDGDLNVPIVHPLVLANDFQPSPKKRKIEGEEPVNNIVVQNGPLKAIPPNKILVELIESLKPEIQDLMESCNSVKTWIQLLIPRIEDGNNFGVSIQEDVLGEVTRIEAEAASFLDQISRYFITRGKVVSKVVKYPHIMDYRRTVIELDEKEYISLKLCCCELKNHYLCLHDAITKNLDKIKKPRSSNTDSLY
ncbi:proteasome activator complex subunit 3-like [Dendronephthya gigantea]|uniref:proteasome activator complex subunit 3-like n=1 Tax=Dendronephthya gigantea TaxID=151771 RepID=UPI00106C0F23|nr:proteasome activator complex subunit 3-like [Dendronephthya gigantea]